jgi:hypothetical protein
MYSLHVCRAQEVPSTAPAPDQPSMIRPVVESFSPADASISASTADMDGTDMQSKEEATVSLQDGAEFTSAPYSSFEQVNHVVSVNQSQRFDVPETASQQQQQQDGTMNHIPNSTV